jgi:site-specific recombinase XerD
VVERDDVEEVFIDGERSTLHVLGKGNRERSIALPAACVTFVRMYRQLRGLPPTPPAFEHAPLIHGLKGGSLQRSGLYDEVKAIFAAAADQLETCHRRFWIRRSFRRFRSAALGNRTRWQRSLCTCAHRRRLS